jgi:hypothetical protein
MATESNATASAQQRRQAKRPRGKQTSELIRHLGLIARQHKVCYEIWPVWSSSEGVRAQIGFEVVLCGVNGHVRREGGVLHPVAICQHCALSYAALREIAEWIVPLKKPPLSYKIHSFDHTLHLGPPNRQYRSEIISSTAILDQAYRNQQDCQSESECLKEVRERLFALGIREAASYFARSANA